MLVQLKKIMKALYRVSMMPDTANGNQPAPDPNAVLDRYFAAVSSADLDKVLATFHANAVIMTMDGEHRGHAAIAAFYKNGIFRCKRFQPRPGPRFLLKNQIAVEIELVCDGEVRMVGDFFTVEHDKFTKMVAYSGPRYMSGSQR